MVAGLTKSGVSLGRGLHNAVVKRMSIRNRWYMDFKKGVRLKRDKAKDKIGEVQQRRALKKEKDNEGGPSDEGRRLSEQIRESRKRAGQEP